jgi:hypothetical protein
MRNLVAILVWFLGIYLNSSGVLFYLIRNKFIIEI